jgi:hypothetical protein
MLATVTYADMAAALEEFEREGMAQLYEADGDA